MQFSGVIWKFILCRIGSLYNIYILIETHVTPFLWHDKIFSMYFILLWTKPISKFNSFYRK